MTKLPLFWASLLLLTMGSALAQDVHYSFDYSIDFSKVKTYKWIALESAAPIEKLTDDQIKSTVDAALAKKGLTKVTGDSTADLFVGYQTAEHETEKFAQHAGWGLGPGWNGNSADLSALIYKGDLVVTMYDPANRHLVWEGTASKTLNLKASPSNRQKNLNKAVTKLLADFPP